jgi:hypothetical protein
LALPTDPAESFVREVDENLRRDQARDFLKKNGPWIVGAILLFLAAVAAWLYWQDRQVKQAEADTERLNAALTGIGAGQVASGTKEVDALKNSDAEGVSAAARLTRAAIALETSDRKAASAEYRSIMDDKGLAAPFRELATVRLTALEFDQMQPAEVITRLEPLAKPGNPWFGSAGEMTAMAMLKAGRKSEAAGCSPPLPPTSRFPTPSVAARCRSPDRWASTPPRRCRHSPTGLKTHEA